MLLPSKYSCKICGLTGLVEAAFLEHCKSDHVVRVLIFLIFHFCSIFQFNILVKSGKSERGELVVIAENEFTNYVGLKPSQTNTNRFPSIGRPVQQQQRFVRRVVLAPSAPSTSAASAPSTTRPPLAVSSENGGNAALMTLAAALSGVGTSSASSASASGIQIETLD